MATNYNAFKCPQKSIEYLSLLGAPLKDFMAETRLRKKLIGNPFFNEVHSFNVFAWEGNIWLTPPTTPRISGLKSQVWNQHFWVKNDGEKWSRIFYFEILGAPSKIPANLPGQFSHYGQIFLHWAAATLKGHLGFQNKKF